MSNESHLAAGNTLLAAGDLPAILTDHGKAGEDRSGTGPEAG
jgi:hypothetical protein